MTALLTAADLEHGFGPRRLFSGLDFSLAAGERLAVTGPNGAGKSTLLRILAGLIRPRAGRVRVAGLPAGEPAARAALGWYGHDAGLQPALSGRENLAWALAVTRPAAVGEIDAEAGRWGAAGWLDRPARGYSAGQGRRLALLRAFAGAPPVLLLDEPFTALDAEGAATLAARLGAHPGAAVFSTHDRAALDHANRRLALDGAGGWALD